jgi:hypothetical protein
MSDLAQSIIDVISDELFGRTVEFLVRLVRETPRWLTVLLASALVVAAALGGAWLALAPSVVSGCFAWIAGLALGVAGACAVAGAVYIYSND